MAQIDIEDRYRQIPSGEHENSSEPPVQSGHSKSKAFVVASCLFILSIMAVGLGAAVTPIQTAVAKSASMVNLAGELRPSQTWSTWLDMMEEDERAMGLVQDEIHEAATLEAETQTAELQTAVSAPSAFSTGDGWTIGEVKRGKGKKTSATAKFDKPTQLGGGKNNFADLLADGNDDGADD
jgi:hypothetical protein